MLKGILPSVLGKEEEEEVICSFTDADTVHKWQCYSLPLSLPPPPPRPLPFHECVHVSMCILFTDSTICNCVCERALTVSFFIPCITLLVPITLCLDLFQLYKSPFTLILCMYIHMFYCIYVHVCLCICHMLVSSHGGQKRALHPLLAA